MGVITALLGMWGQLAGVRFLVYSLVISSLFISTSAVSLAGKPIQVAFLFLAFLLLYLIRTPGFSYRVWYLIQNNQAIKWFTAYCLFAVFISFVAPTVFSGKVKILTFSAEGVFVGDLTFNTGHIAQMIYAIAAMVIFLTVSFLIQVNKSFLTIFASAFLWMGVVNVVFAVADLLNFYAGFPDVISIFKNAEYVMVDQSFGSVRRVAGIFPETSAFSSFTAAVGCFAFFLYRAGFRPNFSRNVAAASLLLVVLATSTSGYVGLAMFGLLVALSEIRQLRRGYLSKVVFFTAIAGLSVALLMSILFYDQIMLVLDTAVFNKLGSDSGLERFSWNSLAWGDFLETYGFGVGLGGNRASSLLIVLLSNVGWIGVTLYSMAVIYVMKGSFIAENTEQSAIGSAAKKGALVALLPAMAAATAPFQGTFFYILLALANIRAKDK